MHKTLKIVQIVPELNSKAGGVKSFLKNLLSCLDPRQTDNIIVTNESDEIYRKEFEALGVTVFSRLKSYQVEANTPLIIIQWMTNLLKQLQPDVVHTHLFWGDSLGRQAAVSANVPIIISTEHNTNFDESIQQRKIKHRLAGRTDSVVCVSQAVKKYSLEVDKIPTERIEVIYNGLVLEDYEFRCVCEEKKQLNFVFVGRLEPQKMPLRLIEAFAEVVAQSYDCCLWIIGDGSLSSECRKKVETLELSKKIHFLGYQENPWSLVSKESIFVLSSDFEGLCIAILEAMALGHLCILPTIPAVLEIAKPKSEAIFYEVGNREQLVAAMIRVIQMSFEQRIQIIKAARVSVEKDFNAYKMAKQYLNLYQNVYQKKLLIKESVFR